MNGKIKINTLQEKKAPCGMWGQRDLDLFDYPYSQTKDLQNQGVHVL